MANIVCLLAAREAKAAEGRAQAAARPAEPAVSCVVYASSETHTWIQKAADMCGLGTDVDPLDCDATTICSMDVAALRRAIEADVPPDDCRSWSSAPPARSAPAPSIRCPDRGGLPRERLWFHVDGAYGGFAAAVPDAPADLRGLERGRLGGGRSAQVALCAARGGLRAGARARGACARAFAYHPPYYHFDERGDQLLRLGPQNSRGFRALKVWLALHQVGAEGYLQMIADDIALSRDMAGAVERHPELELMTQGLSITTFRFVPADLRAGKRRRRASSY